MSVNCENDSMSRKVSAFATFLNSDPSQENRQTLTNENLELLSKFAQFMKQEKLEKHKHEFKHGQKHGKFGKHGHHGMFGHHFGNHGPFGKHGGKHGHKHGRHEFGKHEHDFGKFGHEFFGKHGKHHNMGKIWKHWVMLRQPCENMTRECVVDGYRNPSPPLQGNTPVVATVDGQATANNTNITWNCAGRHYGRHGHWHMCPYRQGILAASRPVDNTTQTAEPVAPQDNLATMVESISIENPTKE